MDAKGQVLERLLKAHRAYFDVERDHAFAGRVFPGYAEFHTHGEQYVLVKRAKLWEVDSHQYLFFDTVERLDMPLLDELVQFMQAQALGKVKPKADHMSSDLGLILIADAVDDDVAAAVRKVRFRKNFKFGIHGWSDLIVAVVDLGRRRVVTNGAGKDMAGVLEANAFGVREDDALR